MKIRTYITHYNRNDKLEQIITHLKSFDIEPLVYDDGSDIVPLNANTHDNRGKRGFWKTWNEILQDCEKNPADIYLFMPDDFLDIDIDRIKEIHATNNTPYAFNIINDGRKKCWVNVACVDMGDKYRIGFVDCGFFCGRDTLEKIGFFMKRPPKDWFERGENMSSGVGMMLTKRMHAARIKVYKPKKSLAYHGTHESKMHPEERINRPLKSI